MRELLFYFLIVISTPCLSQELPVSKPMVVSKIYYEKDLKTFKESIFLESPKEVYRYVKKNISRAEAKILNVENAIYVVDIEIKDSIITKCKVRNFYYSSKGDYLVTKPHNNELFQNVFLNKRITFKFIEEFNDSRYHFKMIGEEF